MDYIPNFTWSDSGEIILKPTPDAQACALQVQARSMLIGGVKGPARVIQDAKLRVHHGQGDVEDSNLLLSQHDLQFGKYRGQTFYWLLCNDMGYAVMIAAAHLKERQAGRDNMSHTMLNKDSLCCYAKLFPDVMRAVEQRMLSDGSLIPASSSALDHKVVDFGKHAKLTYKDFFKSSVSEVQSYRNWLRRTPARSAGTMMDQLRKYVLWRDEQTMKASTSASTSASSASASSTSAASASFASASLCQPFICGACECSIITLTSSSSYEENKEDRSSSSDDDDDDAAMVSAVEEVENFDYSYTYSAAHHAYSRPHSTTGSTSTCSVKTHCWSVFRGRQHAWLSRALFTRDSAGKAALKSELQLWYHPPGPRHIYFQPPTSPEAFFQRPFFLWMPYRVWRCPIVCPVCKHKMTSCGIYKTVRRVLDRDGWYYMGTEYLECRSCGKKLASWCLSILGQLAQEYRSQFPAVLTYRLACDRRVLSQMSGRTLGNSATRLYTFLREEHTRAWMTRCVHYMHAYSQFNMPNVERPPPAMYPQMDPIPGPQWILAAHGNHCYGRIEEMQASITSVYGSILKMDSTKKITKKLAGHVAGTAGWVTNVGNEHGQVLISVLTVAEGNGLKAMAQGLMRRYKQAGVEPPVALYVDRDCCCSSQDGRSAAGRMFSEWSTLKVRLDIWHFMRRLAGVVTTDSHPLYTNFMRRISTAIFVWDPEDVALLKRAKEAAVPGSWGTVSLKEMARHCRRATRGTELTERYLDDVLDAFKDATDTMGVPLLDADRVEPIWATQRRHVCCIQDPPHVPLYLQTGQVTMGGVSLPVYRCARGSTSLESFHLHLNRFIPGTSANNIHFQLYLLEGLTRWNADRSRATVQRGSRGPHLCYSPREMEHANQLSVELFGQRMLDAHSDPSRPYTGELIGVAYLFAQTGQVLEDIPEDTEGPQDEQQVDVIEEEGQDVDEGFQDLMFYLEGLLQNPILQSPASMAQSQTEEV
ncbi:uncharacterized protein LOC114463434 [Gouania willdenowi]|uniref:uncharacterized protein LOC114463434 n=1 Tax=Gouania willdenowi TaxID=441366 RepID=UPI001056AD6A|nr:uncharacterized protein LOC114463434 [Gouania willdenowi]